LEAQMKKNMKVLQNGQNDILGFKRELQLADAKVISC
jgi:hypothetical protein